MHRQIEELKFVGAGSSHQYGLNVRVRYFSEGVVHVALCFVNNEDGDGFLFAVDFKECTLFRDIGCENFSHVVQQRLGGRPIGLCMIDSPLGRTLKVDDRVAVLDG